MSVLFEVPCYCYAKVFGYVDRFEVVALSYIVGLDGCFLIVNVHDHTCLYSSPEEILRNAYLV